MGPTSASASTRFVSTRGLVQARPRLPGLSGLDRQPPSTARPEQGKPMPLSIKTQALALDRWGAQLLAPLHHKAGAKTGTDRRPMCVKTGILKSGHITL